MLSIPPTAVERVCMMGNRIKMLILLPNIQNMKTVINICDLEPVATSHSFYHHTSRTFSSRSLFLGASAEGGVMSVLKPKGSGMCSRALWTAVELGLGVRFTYHFGMIQLINYNSRKK
jgi:hypothetical protein